MPPTDYNRITAQQGNFVTPGPTVGRPVRKVRSDGINHSGNHQTANAQWSSYSGMLRSISPGPVSATQYPAVNNLQTVYNPTRPNFPTTSLQGLQFSNHGSVNGFLQQPPAPYPVSTARVSAFDLASDGKGPSQPGGIMHFSPYIQSFSVRDTDNPPEENDTSETDEFSEINEGGALDDREELDNFSRLNEIDRWHSGIGSRGMSRSLEANLEDKKVGPDDVMGIRRRLEVEITQKIAQCLNRQ